MPEVCCVWLLQKFVILLIVANDGMSLFLMCMQMPYESSTSLWIYTEVISNLTDLNLNSLWPVNPFYDALFLLILPLPS